MSSRAEIQAGAKRYAKFAEDQVLAKAFQPSHEHLEEKRSEGENWAYTALRSIDAEELLRAIARDVWREGTVTPIDYHTPNTRGPERGVFPPDSYGYRLSSENFPVLYKSGSDDRPRIDLDQQQMFIDVMAHTPDGEGTTTIFFRPGRGYRGVSMTPSFEKLQDSVKKSGVAKALSFSIDHGFPEVPKIEIQGPFSNINPLGQHAKDKLCFLLENDIVLRTVHLSLPSKVRERSQTLVGQFPEKLTQNGVMMPAELFQWEHQLKGWWRWRSTLALQLKGLKPVTS